MSHSNDPNNCQWFAYDAGGLGYTQANVKGRLANAWIGQCSSNTSNNIWVGFNYSARGDVLNEYQITQHSGWYDAAATYWENGAIKTLQLFQCSAGSCTNSSGDVAVTPLITYAPDGMGNVGSVSASSGQNPVTSTSYNLSAFTSSVTFGSGDSDTFYADANTGRQTKYVFNVNGATNTGQTNWNSNGSLGSFQVTDNVSSTSDTQTCNYSHDDLSRIASVNCANGGTTKWTQTFTYDRFGNITKNSSGPGIAFNPGYQASTNWITSLPGVTPTTDANGRMTYDGTHTYGWDGENNMTSVDSTTMTYDALGRMVEKNVSGTYTQIVYGPQGRFATMNGQTLVKAFVPLPAGATAVYTSSGLAYYRHSDHLGSSRMATTPSRTLYSSTAYAPYGEPYAQAGTTDLSFTDQEPDTISVTTNGTTPAMYDFLMRKQAPVQGRWLSPDPAGLAVADASNPQSWNRYAYVVNNPMAMIDPLGLDCSQVVGSGGAWVPGCDPGSPTGMWGGTNYGPACSGWCPGGWVDPINPGAELNAGEISYLVNTVPWYQAIDGHLVQVNRIWIPWDSEDGTGYLAEVRVDQGKISDLLSGANNDSWAWTFTKSFFGGLVSSEGWKSVYHSFGEGGCDRLMMETFAEDMSPVPVSDTPGLSETVEPTANFLSGYNRYKALGYAATKGLSYPFKSSIFRGMWQTAEKAEAATPQVLLGVATVHGVSTAAVAAYNGECH